ncbi:MAG: IS4 family transposase, partial [Bacteroidales bacterium]|nr:IS4 family transposase [Bacteroidales bacterium]
LFTMLLTAVQEDKSLQSSVNLFKYYYERQSSLIQLKEAEQLEKERLSDSLKAKKAGRPKQYKSKLRKSITGEVKSQTVAYNNARQRLPQELVDLVYVRSKDFGALEKEEWHGMRTFITDGTYLQLQDTEDIKGEYPVIKGDGSYPQALLQVLIRQSSGQVWDYAAGSRKVSELQLVIPMLENLEEGSLLLADDLYNTYFHFCTVLKKNSHIIVPGKRERNYTVIREITENDLIVGIKKGNRPGYIGVEEWAALPSTLVLRRISYEYPTKEGVEAAVLYTTLTDEKTDAASIVQKYEKRWDIEISIREIKTLMDINVLRSKSCRMLKKELGIALTAYNMVRKIIAGAADKAAFPPEGNIFRKCTQADRPVFLDKRGRVFCKVSTGRPRKSVNTNKPSNNS